MAKALRVQSGIEYVIRVMVTRGIPRAKNTKKRKIVLVASLLWP